MFEFSVRGEVGFNGESEDLALSRGDRPVARFGLDRQVASDHARYRTMWALDFEVP